MIALQFLTIISVKYKMTVNEADVAKSSSVFVLVGLTQGLLLIAVDYASGRVFDRNLVTGMILFMLVLSNGGFHLDGLADTFDAVAAKGDEEKKLSVMKESSTGPIGVIAVFFTLLLKYLALNNLAHLSLHSLYSSLLLMPVFSKWAMVASMFHGTSARQEGLGKMFIDRVGAKEFALSTLMLILSFIAANAVSGSPVPGGQYIFYTVSAMSIYLLCRISIQFFRRRFGGLTGDTLGTIGEITETIFLLMVIAWSQLYF